MKNSREKIIKNSFKKVKSHILNLETKISENRAILEKQLEIIKLLQSILSKLTFNNFPPKEDKSSIGNKGVYLNIHSLNKHSLNTYALTKHSINKQIESSLSEKIHPLESLKEIDTRFSTLTKQEFLTFLTIYQLEDDLKRKITYPEVSQQLNLSEGCIRTYIYQIIKKGIPLKKEKINNRVVVLSIDPHFRSLNLKPKLLAMFNLSDPTQTRLNF